MKKFTAQFSLALVSLLSLPMIAKAGGGVGQHGVCWKSVAFCIAWLLVTSGLIYFSWNKVIVVLFKMKKAKYWQALLLLTTICAFCGPKYFSNKHGCQKSGCQYHHKK